MWRSFFYPNQTLDRAPYFGVGVALMALKYNIDRIIASLFGFGWSTFHYLDPAGRGNLLQQSDATAIFLLTLLLVSLPFIYVGAVATTNRLRCIGLPRWLVVFFFVPLVNLIFLLALAILPSDLSKQVEAADDDKEKHDVNTLLERIVPRAKTAAAAVACFATALPGLAALAIGVFALESYGWALFVGVPFTIGLGAAIIFGYRATRTWFECVAIGAASVATLGALTLVIAIEGVLCIAMAAPIALALGMLGGFLGYFIQRASTESPVSSSLLIVLMLSMPALMGAEAIDPPQAHVKPLRTTIIIDAPPEVVWRYVIEFPPLDDTPQWMFKAGIAYPINARIEGRGVGAIRYCEFSTGPFIEPITIWDEPRLLKFDVTGQPPAMQELSPWGKIDAPHLDDYLVSRGGQFLLTRLPDGRTELEGTTWYEHKIWPQTYWRLWSDAIIHRIHLRVLTHVKQLSEAEATKTL